MLGAGWLFLCTGFTEALQQPSGLYWHYCHSAERSSDREGPTAGRGAEPTLCPLCPLHPWAPVWRRRKGSQPCTDLEDKYSEQGSHACKASTKPVAFANWWSGAQALWTESGQRGGPRGEMGSWRCQNLGRSLGLIPRTVVHLQRVCGFYFWNFFFNYGKICSMKSTLTIFLCRLSVINCIHIAGQPSSPPHLWSSFLL